MGTRGSEACFLPSQDDTDSTQWWIETNDGRAGVAADGDDGVHCFVSCIG